MSRKKWEPLAEARLDELGQRSAARRAAVVEALNKNEDASERAKLAERARQSTAKQMAGVPHSCSSAHVMTFTKGELLAMPSFPSVRCKCGLPMRVLR